MRYERDRSIGAWLFAHLPRRVAVAAVCAILSGACLAQPASDADPFDAAYSAAFGRGRYALGDGTETEIYRANFSKKLRDLPRGGGNGPGVRLLLPVTVGDQAFDDADLPPGREIRGIAQASFLPGVELEFAPGDRWTVRTRAQIGASEEYATDEVATIAAVGVRSRFTFENAALRPSLIGGLLWAAFDPDDGVTRSLVRVTAGVELDVAAAQWQVRGHPMSFRPHFLWDGYYRPSALTPGAGDYARVDSEWQLGVAAHREPGFKLLFVRFDAVGVAWRFSEHSSGLRLYVNSVF